MELDPQAPLIVVPVELAGDQGSRVVDMALDTGATYVLIPWHLAESLGYDPAVSPRKVRLTTASAVAVAPVITLKRMRALGHEQSDVVAACHDLPTGSRVEGLLGLSFLRRLDLDLHFKRRVLAARDP